MPPARQGRTQSPGCRETLPEVWMPEWTSSDAFGGLRQRREPPLRLSAAVFSAPTESASAPTSLLYETLRERSAGLTASAG